MNDIEQRQLAHRACYLEPDGYVVAEDGEVIGLADDGQWYDLPDRPGERGFRLTAETPDAITSADQADAILERIASAEGMAAMFRARRHILARNLEKLETEQTRRAEWLRHRFGPQLEQFARAELGAGRKRTLTLTYGAISFRKTPGSARVVDMDAAVRWAERTHPELIEVRKTVPAPAARRAVEDDLAFGSIEDFPGWLEVRQPEDRCKITTGLEQAPLAPLSEAPADTTTAA